MTGHDDAMFSRYMALIQQTVTPAQMRCATPLAMMATLFAMFISLFTPATISAAPHLSIDLETGRVLSHKQAFDAWHPASLAKLVTAWVVFREIEAGRIALDSPVRVSKEARRQPPSRMGYRVGTVMTVENALPQVTIKSANDISVALAEAVGGTVAGFTDMMNREARSLGMTGSHFVNPHGLHDPRQVTTARDMGILVRALHKRFPQYGHLFRSASILAPQRTKQRRIIQRVYYSYNLLLERYRGGDGFKTGFVCASGYNFIGSATRSGRRIAAVVLGRDSQTSRAVDAAKLITEGFQLPNDAGTPIEELKPDANAVASPRNLRPVMCSAAARAARYEPGAGQAVINSPWLSEREISGKPITVRLGGATAMIPTARAPLPTWRPAVSPNITAIFQTTAGPQTSSQKVETTTESAGDGKVALAVERNLAIPTFRPAGR
ncbi:MAG: D-alanyl-D-alanine carboxypeptidase [Ahrensia sp.]|nr:D-alanyl-D-alanine carboxypeptidase [Ahrensia sp.]